MNLITGKDESDITGKGAEFLNLRSETIEFDTGALNNIVI